VYPALSVLQALKNDAQPVLWVGGEGGMEAGLVTHSGVPYTSIPAAGLHGVGLRTLPGNLLRLARGTQAARRILAEFRPDVLLFTGGYVAAPLAFAGRHIPSLVYCPDVEPGLALKFLGRFAAHIAVTLDETRGPPPDTRCALIFLAGTAPPPALISASVTTCRSCWSPAAAKAPKPSTAPYRPSCQSFYPPARCCT